jgi:cobalt-zinc-cadmium efflux system protein
MGHDHDHEREHEHGHAHAHEAPADPGRAFFIATTLNLGFVVVGAVAGLVAHSMALVADAAHNLGDVLGLALAWGAAVLARREATRRRTYGLRSSSILAAFLNALVLLVATGGVAWEAVRRLFEPAVVASGTVMLVAGIGVVVNLTSGLLFARGRKDDINVHGAYLHLMADAAASLGVVVAGAVMHFTGWSWPDPVASLVLSAAIVAGTWSLLRRSVDLILHAVPDGIDPEAVQAYLRGLPGVTDVHHVHIWPLSTTEVALTAHLVVPPPGAGADLLAEVAHALQERFRIGHSTVQVEPAACEEAA